MSEFGGDVDKYCSLLNPDICKFHAANTSFNIEETNESGKAVIKTCSHGPCLQVIKADKHVFPVVKRKKCADQLVFTFDPVNDSWQLDIFELTKTISDKIWNEKISPQFEGGLINAYAISGILHITKFSVINLHCCYQNDKGATAPVRFRSPLGEPAQHICNYLKEPVKLDSFPNIITNNIPIKLDQGSGEAVFQIT